MKKILLLLFVITLGFGCSHDEQINTIQNSDKDLTEAEALDILHNLLSTNPQTRNYISKLTVNAKSYYSVDNEDYPMYHILIEGEELGFALISADKRCPEIICYVPKGQLSDTILYEGTSELIRMAEVGVAEKIRMRSSRERYSSDSLYLISEVTPLLETTWDQKKPYNAMNETTTCPLFANEDYNWKYPVGCQAVAVAQVLAYYEKSLGFSINWQNLKQNPTISESEIEKAALIANYMKLIAINLDMEYDCDGGGATINKAQAYLSINGVSLTNQTSGQFNDVAYSWLDNGNLLYLTGRELINGEDSGRHAWLADGYKKYGYHGSTYTYYLLHMNMGWGGNWDGYYSMKSNMSINFRPSNSLKFDQITYYKISD